MKIELGTRINGNCIVKYHDEKKRFLILLTIYGYYQGIYYTESNGRLSVDREKMRLPEDNHFKTLEQCKISYDC